MQGEIAGIGLQPDVPDVPSNQTAPNPGDQMAPAPTTVPEVLARLETYQRALDATPPRYQNDGIASFNFLYTIITRDVLDKLNAGTYFEDNHYLATLDVVFATRYFSAVDLCPGPDLPCPAVWEVLLQHRDNPAISPLQFAVAGVNAHINFDLAMAAVSTAEQLGRPLGDGSQRQDFQRVNAIFAEHMHQLRQHFEGRLVQDEKDLDLAGLGDVVDDLVVVSARAVAWHHAEHLWTLRQDPSETGRWIHGLDTLVSLASRAVLTHLPITAGGLDRRAGPGRNTAGGDRT